MIYLINLFSISSNETPLVSGILNKTHISWTTIIKAKKTKMGHGFSLKIPSFSSKNKGVIKVMIAAKTQ